MEWIAFYDDGSTFDSDQGSWEEAPAWSIQAIAYKASETGWSICTDGDYFIRLENGEFLPLDKDGLVDYAANVWRKAKVGRMISRDEFAKIHGLALAMMGEIKTAHFGNERQVDD